MILKVIEDYITHFLGKIIQAVGRFFTLRRIESPNFAIGAPAEVEKNLSDEEKKEAARILRKRQKLFGRGRGSWFTLTANFCLICKKPLNRNRGQTKFYCDKTCRIGRHNKKRVIAYLKKLRDKNERIYGPIIRKRIRLSKLEAERSRMYAERRAKRISRNARALEARQGGDPVPQPQGR